MATIPETLLLFKQCLLNAVFRRLRVFIFLLFLGTFLVFWFHQQPGPELEGLDDLEDHLEWERLAGEERLALIKQHAEFYVEQAVTLSPISRSWTGEEFCPACFGTEMCEAINQQKIQIHVPVPATEMNLRGIYFGMMEDMPIVIKRLSNASPKEFMNFDSFVCRNVTGSGACDVKRYIVDGNSPALKTNSFEPENLYTAWKISYPTENAQALSYAMCLTKDMSEMLSLAFDSDRDGKLTDEQKAMLFTSMIVQPESLMLKFLQHIKYESLSPKIYGACGRLLVVAHAGRPLSSYVNSTFTVRVELALQLLSLVSSLWHADPKWFVLYKDFQYENVAVSHDNEVFLVDYEDLSVIQNDDKTDHQNEDEKDEESAPAEICNGDCFTGLFSSLSKENLDPVERVKHCSRLHTVSGALMYSMICRNILSDLREHRVLTPPAVGLRFRGLLHSVPESEETKTVDDILNRTLSECVAETKPGGRDTAIQELTETLFLYTKHLG